MMKKTIERPSAFDFLMTPFGFTELLVLLARYPELKEEPRGNRQPVLVIPGLLADDVSTIPLRLYLHYLGYKPYGWKQGLNLAFTKNDIAKLKERIVNIAESRKEKIALIGWSLGGLIARELAREMPEQVSLVMSLGTPLIGGAKHTGLAGIGHRIGFDLDAIERQLQEDSNQPIEQPITVIYSKLDGLIAWEATQDNTHPQAEHFEVKSTHIGLGLDIDVFKIIARQLHKQLQK